MFEADEKGRGQGSNNGARRNYLRTEYTYMSNEPDEGR